MDTSGAVRLNGLVGRDSEAKLRSAMSKAAPDAPTDWQISPVASTFCPVLNALRSALPQFGQPPPGLILSLKGGQTTLKNDDWLVPEVRTPDFPSVLTLAYFVSDGSFSPLAYEPRDKILPPATTCSIGDPKPADGSHNLRACQNCWQVGAPFGTDLMVAIASEKPLFAKPPAADIKPEAYLRDVKAALDAAARRGTRVVAQAILVHTVDGPAAPKR